MSLSTPSVRTDDDKLIVEAPTAEAALELVAERLGTRARIAGVERVRRGGVGGFFARELVQVTATGEGVRDGAGPAQPHARAGEAREALEATTGGAAAQDAAQAATGNPVDRLLRELANRDDPFATALSDQLTTTDQAPGPVTDADPDHRATAGGTSPAPGSEEPQPSAQPAPAMRAQLLYPAARAGRGRSGGQADAGGPASAPLPGTPLWSVRNLCRLGLPPLVPPEEAAGLADADDITWTSALAERLRRLCRPLPPGPTVIVGPAAERLAGALELPTCWPGQQVPPESFVAPITGGYGEREWLAEVRGQRHLHLVVGGPAWRGLLFDEPVVLSHSDVSMCEAVSLAYQLDIGLGYACDASGAVTRTNPIDLATAIRRLLPVHP